MKRRDLGDRSLRQRYRRIIGSETPLQDDPNDPSTALAGSTGAGPTQSIVLRVAKAIYRTHNRPLSPSWDRTSREVRDFTLAQARAALAVVDRLDQGEVARDLDFRPDFHEVVELGKSVIRIERDLLSVVHQEADRDQTPRLRRGPRAGG
jgi:hypothetical protein